MRYYNTELDLNANILIEIEKAIWQADHDMDKLLSSNMEDVKIKFAIQKDCAELKNNQDIYINAYYEDLKKAILGKLAVNTEKINSIYIGNWQLHTLIDYLMIEGIETNVASLKIIYSSPSYAANIVQITHPCLENEMRFLTHNFIFSFFKECNFQIEEKMEWNTFDAICGLYLHITRLFLHHAFDRLYKEGLFDLHLKNRPFHIYYGEPNSLFYSVFYIGK